MFEFIHSMAPPTLLATDAELGRIEQTYVCRLPDDYRVFMKTFGPGTLDDGTFSTDILSPNEVIAQTEEMRALYHEPGKRAPWHLLFFDAWDNAPTYFTLEDIDRLIVFASDDGGSTSVILPNDLPRYFELLHDGPIGDGGTTMDSFLTYLDPRVRYEPHARRIVENGVVRETDGRPDGTPCILRFTPRGYESSMTRPMVEQEITWGHSDDKLVTWNLLQTDIGRRPTDISFFIRHYPLLALLEAIALRDISIRFEAEESDVPTARLIVPRFEATLRVGAGMQGLTLYVTVPEEHARTLYRWLADQTNTLGYEVPRDLRALAEA